MISTDADKRFDIVVNGTPYPVASDEVSFDQVVDLAYPDGGRRPAHHLHGELLQQRRAVHPKASSPRGTQPRSRTGPCSMSHALIARSRDLRRLQDQGYSLKIVDEGYLLVENVPYVTPNSDVQEGTLVMELTLNGDTTVAPATHVANWTGGFSPPRRRH